MTHLLRLRARPILLALAVIGLALFLLALTSCETISTKTQGDIVNSQQVIYNAAQSLPPSPQTIAIEANAAATANALGTPIPMPGTPVAPAPSTTAAGVTP